MSRQSPLASKFPPLVLNICRLQCAGALGIGLSLLTLSPYTIHTNPISTWIANIIPGHERSALTAADFSGPIAVQTQTLAGLFCSAIGLAYSLAFYRGYDQWLEMAIPVRIAVGALGFGVWVLAPQKISPLFFVVVVNDFVGGVVMWWAMRGYSVSKKSKSI